MMKRLFCILLSLMLLATAPFALAEDTAAEAEAPAADLTPVLLVTVNGEEIMSDNSTLTMAYANYIQTAQNYGMDVSSEDVDTMLKQYSMQYTIQYTLILQKAKELGLDTVTDEEKAEIEASVRESWNLGVQGVVDQMGTVTAESTDEEKAAARADAEAYIKENYGYTEDLYVQESLDVELNNLVVEHLRDHLSAGQEVSEEEVQKYFDDLVAEDRETYQDIGNYEFYTQYYGQSSYYTPEGYRGIIHILLPVDETLLNDWKDKSARLEEQKSDEEAEATATEAPAEAEEPAESAEPTEEPTPTPEPVTQEMVDAAKQAVLDSVQGTVDEIKAKLDAGTSFEDLIKEYGTDPGMKDETNLAEGYKVHQDSILWDPAFTKAAMSLEKVGDISEPVVGDSGVHILQYLRDIPGGPAELTSEMKEEFRATLLDEAKTAALQAAIDEWMKTAAIEYTAEGEIWKLVPQEEEEIPAEEEPAAETEEAPVSEADIPAEETTEKPE